MKVISHRLPWVWISDTLLQLAYCANVSAVLFLVVWVTRVTIVLDAKESTPSAIGAVVIFRTVGEAERWSQQGRVGGGGVGDEASSTLRVENVGTSTLAKVVTMRLPDAGGGEG